MPQTLLFALDSAPEQAATHIPNAWLAQGLRVQSADIHAIDFENWLKVLRAALPAQTQIKLETNPAIAAGTLAISQLEPE